MKKRILFVDDEPMLLDLFELALRPLREEFEFDFVNSGQRALELMEVHSYDIVFSDMVMPRMTGAQLLEEVKTRSPHTIRVIFSGYLDERMLIKTIGSTHQCLAKPFDVSTLLLTLKRLCGLDDWLASQQLRTVVSQIGSLPSAPVQYQKLLTEAQAQDSSVQRLSEIIEKDLSMTAKLLQLVNSAFFGFSREVSNVAEAIQLIGVATVRRLAIMVHVFQSFPESDFYEAGLDKLWRHSLITGVWAKKIMELEESLTQGAEAALTAGLLHDVGKLVLAARLPDEYQQILRLTRARGIPQWQVEKEILDGTHSEIGAYWLGMWALPHSVIESVGWHHAPQNSQRQTFGPLTAVHVANALAHHSPEHPAEEMIDAEYLERLGLQNRWPHWRDACLAMNLPEN